MNPILSLLLLPLLSAGSTPDRVTFQDSGKVLQGRVVFDTPRKLVLRQGNRDVVLDPAEVGEVQSLERSLARVLERDVSGAGAAEWEELARSCAAVGLEAESRNFWLRVLLADPKHEAAGRALGVQRVKDEVRVPFGKEKRTPAQLMGPQPSWKQALEIDCTHFKLKTDIDLPLALEVAFALERNFQRFYATLGAPLELYVFDEAPQVCIYARSQDFPVGPLRGDPIWFAPGINTLNILAEGDPSIPGVVREMTRLMLFNALRRSAGATAQVPAWTGSGISELFAKAAPTVRFGQWSPIGTPDKRAFERAAADKLPLEKLLNGSTNDFNGDAKRGDWNAAAYTLVHYLAFGRDGTLRAGFGKYLREGAKGKLSIGALCDALETSRKDLESGWRAYVESLAR